MGKSKTTRKDIMINPAFHALVSGQSELLAVGAKYFNELMNGYGLEFNMVHFDCDKDWVDSENHEHHKWVPYNSETKFLFD